MIEVKRSRAEGVPRRGGAGTGGGDGGSNEERGGWARTWAEDRLDDISSRLAMGEAIESKRDQSLRGWELEEELLDEAAELERFLTEEDEPGTSRVQPVPGPGPRGRKRWR